MFNPDDKIRRAFPFYALSENVSEMRIPSNVHSKDKYVLELGNEIRPLTLSRGLFSYAGLTLTAKYGCDPHSMFTLNTISMINEETSKSGRHTAVVNYMRKDALTLCILTSLLILNAKSLEKLCPELHKIIIKKELKTRKSISNIIELLTNCKLRFLIN